MWSSLDQRGTHTEPLWAAVGGRKEVPPSPGTAGHSPVAHMLHGVVGEPAADILAVRITWQVIETKPSSHYLCFSPPVPPKPSPSVSQKGDPTTTLWPSNTTSLYFREMKTHVPTKIHARKCSRAGLLVKPNSGNNMNTLQLMNRETRWGIMTQWESIHNRK